MQIDKFKIKDGEVFIDYTIEKIVGEETSEDNIAMKSKDKPLESLNKALTVLKSYVIGICELPENALVSVTGVSFSWNDGVNGRVMGAVIIARMDLQKSTGVVNLITPHRITDFYAENGDEGQLMPSGMQYDLEILIEEVKHYLNGNRLFKQLELELENK